MTLICFDFILFYEILYVCIIIIIIKIIIIITILVLSFIITIIIITVIILEVWPIFCKCPTFVEYLCFFLIFLMFFPEFQTTPEIFTSLVFFMIICVFLHVLTFFFEFHYCPDFLHTNPPLTPTSGTKPPQPCTPMEKTTGRTPPQNWGKPRQPGATMDSACNFHPAVN